MKQLFTLFLAFAFVTVQAQVSVTFSVDMNAVGASSDGVFVTGSWMGAAGLGGDWQEPGSNASAAMSDDDGDGVYTLTVSMAAGEYQFKFANGSSWPNGEAGGGGDNYQADLSSCGGVDNGFGGYNRTMTVPAGDAFAITTYEFNSCTESTVLNTDNVSSLGNLTIAPNPAKDLVNITFENANGVNHDINLFSLTGQLVSQTRLGSNNSATLDVSALPTGMYLLQFTNERGERGTRKLMVR